MYRFFWNLVSAKVRYCSEVAKAHAMCNVVSETATGLLEPSLNGLQGIYEITYEEDFLQSDESHKGRSAGDDLSFLSSPHRKANSAFAMTSCLGRCSVFHCSFRTGAQTTALLFDLAAPLDVFVRVQYSLSLQSLYPPAW